MLLGVVEGKVSDTFVAPATAEDELELSDSKYHNRLTIA